MSSGLNDEIEVLFEAKLDPFLTLSEENEEGSYRDLNPGSSDVDLEWLVIVVLWGEGGLEIFGTVRRRGGGIPAVGAFVWSTTTRNTAEIALRKGSIVASEVCRAVIRSNADAALCPMALGSSCHPLSRMSHLHAAKTDGSDILFTAFRTSGTSLKLVLLPTS